MTMNLQNLDAFELLSLAEQYRAAQGGNEQWERRETLRSAIMQVVCERDDARRAPRLTPEQASKIYSIALDLEAHRRIAGLSHGEPLQEALMRNQSIKCALQDFLALLSEKAVAV